jgi:hypothetical protein
MGGLNTTIDEKAAAELRLTRGRQKLGSNDILTYLSPFAGIEESRIRQASLIRNLYEDLSKKAFVPTLLLAEQLLTNTESNFIASDIMDQYNKFITKNGWSFNEHTFPATVIKHDNSVFYEPDLMKCKLLLNKEEIK